MWWLYISVPKKISGKVSSVQEACAKCLAVHILKFEILQTTSEKLKTKSLMFFVSYGLQDFKF